MNASEHFMVRKNTPLGIAFNLLVCRSKQMQNALEANDDDDEALTHKAVSDLTDNETNTKCVEQFRLVE